MNAMAERYAEQGVGSIFVYTNEAHPGENYPELRSMAQKHDHARALRDIYGVTRPIYLDALDGACHRAYGSMPNMTWIFNRSGTILYRSDWSNAASAENAIVYFLDVVRRRREGERMAGFRVERMDFRTQDRERFYAALERNGPRAVTEFDEAFK